jgi:hypothetical protein
MKGIYINSPLLIILIAIHSTNQANLKEKLTHIAEGLSSNNLKCENYNWAIWNESAKHVEEIIDNIKQGVSDYYDYTTGFLTAPVFKAICASIDNLPQFLLDKIMPSQHQMQGMSYLMEKWYKPVEDLFLCALLDNEELRIKFIIKFQQMRNSVMLGDDETTKEFAVLMTKRFCKLKNNKEFDINIKKIIDRKSNEKTVYQSFGIILRLIFDVEVK